MPHKAFLHKNSLLDQFKDDHKHTGIIQSRRAEHTWDNPLTRRKRTKKLNGWIKSFDGKNHIRKLSRFNAIQAHRHESIVIGESAMQNEAMSLKGFIENLSDKLVNKYSLEKDMVKNYLNLHTEEMQELLDDKELSLKEKVLFVRSEITGEQDEKKSEEFTLDFPVVVYKGDAENAEKAVKYLWEKIPEVKSAYFACEVKPKDGNNFCRVYLAGPKTFATQMFMTYRDMFNNEFWNDCDADPQGWVNPQTIAGYDVATPRQESKKSEFYMDGDDSEDYYYCQRCGRVTPSYELDAHDGFCSDCDAQWTAEHENESKDTNEKLGYEKGHKNSKGENAPWVIRSHEDNRILASFANKKDAEEHLKRMKQYSKGESKKSEGLSNEKVKDAVKFAATEAGLEDYLNVDSDGAMSVTVSLPINSDSLKTVRWVIDSNDGTITEYLDTEKNLVRDFTDDESLVSMLTLLFQTSRMELRDWLPKKSEALFNKKELEEPVKSYISDVLSDLVVSFHWGEDGAERLVDKYNDVIMTNYMDGDLSAYETAKYIDGKENPNPVESKKTKSSKKSESKMSEMRLVRINTIVVPKWLWDAHVFGKDYGDTLTDEEEEILANFEEEYGTKYYLDDEGNESYFSSHNDFDEYGGPCYEIQVFKEK